MNKDLQKFANSHAFTLRHDGLSNVLKTKIQIFEPNSRNLIYRDAEGIWDTGATNTVISKDLAETLGLFPVSYGQTNTANGKMPTAIYYLALGLPNQILIPRIRVSDGKLPCDLLIGMDIIGCGDFHISNSNAKTVFSFKMPSTDEKDYVKDVRLARACAAKAAPPKKKK